MSRKPREIVSDFSGGPVIPVQPAEPKDAKFRRLGNRRLKAALKSIRALERLSNRYSYTYTPEQAATIIKSLSLAVETVVAAFNGQPEAADVPLL